MNMLMAVDIIRCAAEGFLERVELRPDFGFEQVRVLQMRERPAGHRRKRRKRAITLRREVLRERPKRPGQRHMQTDRGACADIAPRGSGPVWAAAAGRR